MKTLQLNVAIFIASIYCTSIGVLRIVSGTPQKHKAEDDREYLIETEYKYNWFEAFHECARRNSQLLIIDSEEKNTVIINLLKKVLGRPHNLWLGGNDEFSFSLDKDRPFFWSATGKKFTFTFWSVENPNNQAEQEHCVHIWEPKPLYEWNDNYCLIKLGFICEENSSVDSQLSIRLRSLEEMLKDGKMEIQKLQNIIESADQKPKDQQELTAKTWDGKLQKQGNGLSDHMKYSTQQINGNFAEQFNASFPYRYLFKNVVLIHQGL